MRKLQRHKNLINNKYTNWYITIIENRIQNPIGDGYTENHHILPRSLGGSNNLNNLVRLSAREHFICHYLLTKMFSNKTNEMKMRHAFNLMGVNPNKKAKRYINNRLYEKKKIELWDLMKGYIKVNNGKKDKHIHPEELNSYLSDGWKIGSWYTKETGRYVSEERKEILRQMTGEKNPNYGRVYGKDIRKKMSEKKKGRIYVTKNKVSKMIDKHELDSYIQDGWKRGRYEEPKNIIWIKNDFEEKQIHPDDLEEWQNKGYIKGRFAKLECATKGKISITNGKENKYINDSDEIPEGWNIGQTRFKLGFRHSEESKKLISERKKGKKKPPMTESQKKARSELTKNRIPINNGIKNSHCYRWELESKIGWTHGHITDKRIWITNDIEDIFAKEKDFHLYPGFKKGRCNSKVKKN